MRKLRDSDKAAIRGSLLRRFWLRFHMSLILIAAVAVGLLATKVMLAFGVDSMLVRYPIAIVLSYLSFLGGVRVWLAYTGFRPFSAGFAEVAGDAIDQVELPGGQGTKAGSLSARPSAGILGGDDAGDADGGAVVEAIGDEHLALIVAALVAVAVVLGLGIYVVYEAPTILTEIVFEVLLAAGLVRASRKAESGNWAIGAIRATWWQLAIVVVVALVLACICHAVAPEARTFREALLATGGAS